MDFGKISVLITVLIACQIAPYQNADVADGVECPEGLPNAGIKCQCPPGQVPDPTGKQCVSRTHVEAPCKGDADCKTGEKCVENSFGFVCDVADCAENNDTCEQCGGTCKYDADSRQHFCDCPDTKMFNSGAAEDDKNSRKVSPDLSSSISPTTPGEVTDSGLSETPPTSISEQSATQEETSSAIKTESDNDTIITLLNKADGGIEQTDATGSTTVYDDVVTASSTITTMIDQEIPDICQVDSDCKNGAKCDKSKCVCFGKTSGIRCEDVDCSDVDPLCSTSKGSCKYDAKKQAPFCECPETKYFNDKTKQCEVICKEDTDCKNGAKCVESKCKCLEKISGIFCESVDCSDISPDCNQSGGSCKYDVEKEMRFCDCPKTRYFNTETKKCEVVCKEEKDCENGAKCVESECKCLDKISGMFCEIVDCSDISPACNQSGGSCKYDVEKEMRFCDCPKTSIFNTETKICEVTNDSCNHAKPKCLQSTGKCKLNQMKEIHCICPQKKEYIKDNGCAVLESVCDSSKPKCRETRGYCHVTEEQDAVECICPGKKEYSERIGCSVNKCREKCGSEVGVVTCKGDPFGEANVECECKDENLTFVAEERACRRVKKALSLLAIVGIVCCVIAAAVISALFFIRFNKSSENSGYHYSNAETIAFESALYNATYESVEMRSSQDNKNIP